MSFRKCKNVYYPNETYLISAIRNKNLYMHDISQNSEIAINRTIQTNSLNGLNLKNADYVFHSEVITPVIQFHYQLVYTYSKKPPKEAEPIDPDARKEKIFYILDKEGNLKKFDFE